MSRRSVLATIVLLLGAIAAPELEMAYLPSGTTPRIGVELVLPQIDDLANLTDRYVVPIESAIRSIGGVREIVGRVHSRGARLEVRLSGNVDPIGKAARLQAELSVLEGSLLPDGSRIRVEPARLSNEQDMILFFESLPSSTPSALEFDRLRRRLEAIASVRRVDMAGLTGRKLEIRSRQTSVSPAVLQSVVERGLADSYLGSSLGEDTSIRRPLYLTSSTDRWQVSAGGQSQKSFDLEHSLRRLPILVGNRESRSRFPMRLDAIADFTWRQPVPELAIRKGGQHGVAFLVYRESSSTPRELSRDVRRFLREGSWESKVEGGRAVAPPSFSVLLDRAEPLSRLLVRFGAALLATALLVFLLALALGRRLRIALWWGLTPVLATSATAASILWLSRQGMGNSGTSPILIDVTTLPMILIAIGAGPTVFAFRQLGIKGTLPLVPLAAAIPLVASRLSGEAVSALLTTPAQLLLITAVVSALTGFLPPAHEPARSRSSERAERISRSIASTLLRHGWAVVLLLGLLSYLALSVASSALRPHTRSIEGALADLSLQLRFGEGITMDQAAKRIEVIESHLLEQPEVLDLFSVFRRDSGAVFTRIRSKSRSRSELHRLARQLEFQLADLPVSITGHVLRSSAQGEATDMSGQLASRPHADQDARSYRFLLTSTSLKDLEQSLATVDRRLAAIGLGPREVSSEWDTRAEALILEPVARTAGTEIDQSHKALTELLEPEPVQRLPGQMDSYVIRAAHRRFGEALNSSDELLDRSFLERPLPTVWQGVPSVLGIEHLFDLHSVTIPPSARREDGRFVLPIDVQSRRSPARRFEERRRLHSALANLSAPPSVQVIRPRFDRWAWIEETFWLMRPFLVLPLLLLLLASIRLDSLVLGSSALLPAGVAVAACAITLKSSGEQISELGLLTLAAGLCMALPISIASAGAAARHLERPAGSLAWMRFSGQALTPLALATLALTLPAMLAQLLVSADLEPWALPLRLSAIALFLTAATGATVTPLLVAGRFALERFNRAAIAGQTRPCSWQQVAKQESGGGKSLPHLEARNLTKVYRGASSPSLSSVHFDLGPGIVGLLGPNGAGKTTLLRLLCGLLEPTRGHTRFQGIPVSPLNIASFRQHVGFLPQGFNAYEATTARRFLDFWALEKGLLEEKARAREVERVLELVSLKREADRDVRNFSGGMRRRIGIARALLGDPPILIVDEPTTGLDLESRDDLRQSLLSVAGDHIVLFSTHIASDISGAAKRILVLDQGRLIFDGSSKQMLEQAAGAVFETEIEDHLLQSWSRGRRISTRVRTPTGVRVRFVMTPGEQIPEAARAVQPKIEEAYLALIASDSAVDVKSTGYASLLDLPSTS